MKGRRRKGCAGCILWLMGVFCLLVGSVYVVGFLFSIDGKDEGVVQNAVQILEEKHIPFQEVELEEAEVKEEFYYSQLSSEEEQLMYKEMLQGLLEGQKEIYLHGEAGGLVNDIFGDVLNDHPEIFWCSGKGTTTTFPKTFMKDAYTIFEPVYTCSEEERLQRIQKVEEASQECYNRVVKDASEYEKIKTVYEYLIDTVEYNKDAPDNQNIYSALTQKQSVCAGYARSTQYLLQRLGVTCVYVTGTATDVNGGMQDHAWNLVKCDNEWYYVDTTWGDPVFLQDEKQVFQSAKTYDYLCCSEKELLQTHELTEGYSYPFCQSEKYNYYRLNDMYYEKIDEEKILQAMYESIEQGDSNTIFKFADQNLYRQGRDLIVERLINQAASYLGVYYGLYKISYYYEESALANKIIIYWCYE